MAQSLYSVFSAYAEQVVPYLIAVGLVDVEMLSFCAEDQEDFQRDIVEPFVAGTPVDGVFYQSTMSPLLTRSVLVEGWHRSRGLVELSFCSLGGSMADMAVAHEQNWCSVRKLVSSQHPLRDLNLFPYLGLVELSFRSFDGPMGDMAVGHDENWRSVRELVSRHHAIPLREFDLLVGSRRLVDSDVVKSAGCDCGPCPWSVSLDVTVVQSQFFDHHCAAMRIAREERAAFVAAKGQRGD